MLTFEFTETTKAILIHGGIFLALICAFQYFALRGGKEPSTSKTPKTLL
jgi:hypothetical protein